MTELVTTLPTK